MYTPADTAAVVTATRSRWGEFAAKADAAGRGDVANFVLNQVGCASGACVGVALDADRWGLYQRLMTAPPCPVCGGWGVEDASGAPCQACDGGGRLREAA